MPGFDVKNDFKTVFDQVSRTYKRYPTSNKRNPSAHARWAAGKTGIVRNKVDIAGFYDQVRHVVERVVNSTTLNALQVAQAKVPVRHVFKGGRRSPIHYLSKDQIAKEFSAYTAAFPKASGQPWTREEYLAQRQGARAREHPNRAQTWGHKVRLGTEQITAGELRGLVRSGRGASASWGFEFPQARSQLTGQGMYEYMHLARKNSALSHGQAPGAAVSAPSEHLGGALYKSLHTEQTVKSAGHIRYSVVAGGETAPYAKYQEFGTRHNAAHPFMRPALKQVEQTYSNRMAYALRVFGKTRQLG